MSLAILFHFLCAQHVSDINISIIRSLRLCWWITTSVVLFSFRCVLELWCGWFWGWCSFCRLELLPATRAVLKTQPHQSSNTQRTENKTTVVVIHQHSRKLLKMDILMSETCWAHKKWNKIASDIKLVVHLSTTERIFSRKTFLWSVWFRRWRQSLSLLSIPSKNLFLTTKGEVKDWQCCLKRRLREAFMYFPWPPLEAALSI